MAIVKDCNENIVKPTVIHLFFADFILSCKRLISKLHSYERAAILQSFWHRYLSNRQTERLRLIK
jgi:hypothetical protein